MTRRYQVIKLSVFVFALLIMVLQPLFFAPVQQKTASQIDGIPYVQEIEASSLGPQIWSDNLTAQDDWLVANDNGVLYSLSFSEGFLNFTVFFPGSVTHQAANLYHAISIPFLNSPIAVATVTASNGIHYGMRFSGNVSGTSFNAWYESSPMQHRPGLGTNETLTTGLATDAYFANGYFLSQNAKITRVKFYVESVARQSGWFSLILYSISLFQTQRQHYVDDGSYNGLLVHLTQSFNTASGNQSLFEAYAGVRIRGTPDLYYRLYFNKGLKVIAEGYTYHLKSLTDYEFAALLPQAVQDFPLAYSNSNDSYISVVALQGEITYFQLDTLVFNYKSQPIVVSGDVDPNLARYLVVYYFIFLFVVPVTLVLLFSKAFRNEQETASRS